MQEAETKMMMMEASEQNLLKVKSLLVEKYIYKNHIIQTAL